MTSEYIVELKNVTKKFPGVVALRKMSIQIKPGEVHGLIGENGAGKSTLIKVLTGINIPEEGEIFISGEKVKLKDPNDARNRGIACVYQELNIVKMLSITDNIFVGHTLTRGKSPMLDYPKMHKKAKKIMQILCQDINPKAECGKQGMGIQQMVEIAKAVLAEAKLIIMDEPTSSLSGKEVEQLFKVVRDLKKRGIAILFVSHKLEELFELCDRVTVMRDGEHILTEDMSTMTNDRLINAMVGRSLSNLFPHAEPNPGEIVFKADHIKATGLLHDISFSARRGEILSFFGLVGAGRTELFLTLFGAMPLDDGEIYINGKKVNNKSPYEAIKNKMALLTEDRKGQGLVLSQSIETNLIMANMKYFSKGIFLNNGKIKKIVEKNIGELNIKTPSSREVVSKLSGGNQQKVVVGKWSNTDAEVYIFDEPTRGIDVGAKIEVYNVMNKLVKENKCVIMISSELPEILGMSDKLIVMRSGRIMAEMDRNSNHFNQEDIMKAAWGGVLD